MKAKLTRSIDVLKFGAGIPDGQFEDENDHLIASGGAIGTKDFGSIFGTQARKARSKVIQHITNEWLVDQNNTNGEILGEYDIKYYNNPAADYLPNSSSLVDLDRTNNYKDHHFAGMTVLQENGSRYVYGIPAMNKLEVSASFSVENSSQSCEPTTPFSINGNEVDYKGSGTDEFLQRTETPAYAHSYLLTSILGADYVDVNGNGPDEADYGYWVKFSYVKAHDNFKWRSPYTDAHFSMGAKSKYSDNKGSYTYGEKEIWYIAKAETNSHVAIFDLEDEGTPGNDFRVDGLGAAGELAQGTDQGSQALKKLHQIRLYTRSEYEKATSNFNNSIPLQTIEFGYDNSLSGGLPNSTSGKLTLKSVEFSYQKNKRGALNPYTFTYASGAANPSYSQYNYDRWGNYTNESNQCLNKDFPYVRQFDHFQESRNQVQQSKHQHCICLQV